MTRYTNEKHLSNVREFNCLLESFGRCEGHICAHHLLKPWNGKRGTGLRANDRNVVPMCAKHHTYLHDKHGNELAFFGEMTGDENYGKTIAQSLWLTSPHYEPEEF